MNEKFHRVLNWTPDNQAHWQEGLKPFPTGSAGRKWYIEEFGPPVPWPVIMLAQRLAWHGRTQEAFEVVARLS